MPAGNTQGPGAKDSNGRCARPCCAFTKVAIYQEHVMQINATEAKNSFGSICALAKHEPVFVEKLGQIDTVMLSADHCRALQANQINTSLTARKKKFKSEFGEWIAAQNSWVEKNGIPGLDLRPW